MTINPLTGNNTSPLMAPRLSMGELWFFFSIYKQQRSWLHQLAGAHALGELDLPPREHRALIGELRKIHSVTKGLGTTIDKIYEPHIKAIMAEPEHVKPVKVVALPPPKRKRGRPKGSRDKKPRKKYKKRKAAGPTVTAPDMSGAVRIEHPDGTIIKRRPGRPRKVSTG